MALGRSQVAGIVIYHGSWLVMLAGLGGFWDVEVYELPRVVMWGYGCMCHCNTFCEVYFD
jgi:hypothetical protein